jgi:hypothetical protein
MSTIEEVIVNRLGADATVDALIDGRVHALVMPQNATLPCIVYQLVSGPDLEIAEYVRPRIQLSCWASTYPQAVALANAARACFYNQHLTVLGVHFRSWTENTMDDDPDLEAGRYRRIVDVRLDYQNPT